MMTLSLKTIGSGYRSLLCIGDSYVTFKANQKIFPRRKGPFQSCRYSSRTGIVRKLNEANDTVKISMRYSSNLSYLNLGRHHKSHSADITSDIPTNSSNTGPQVIQDTKISLQSDNKLNAKSLKVKESSHSKHVQAIHTNDPQTNAADDLSAFSSRRVDPSLVKQVYYFDTLAVVKKLEASGFSRQQAEGCAECLVDLVNTTLDHQGRHMISKPEQEIAVQQLMSEIISVKKDMTLLQKSEFSSLKTDTEKISIALTQVQDHVNDEIVKLKGQFSLDVNLERGRAVEAHADNEKRLQQLHNKIDTEVANLKTTYEVYRNDIFKYAGGTVIAVGGLMLGILRIMN